MSLRIAIVVNRLDFGGTESAVRRLALGAAARGVRLQVWAVRGLGGAADALRRGQVTVASLDVAGGLRQAPWRTAAAALRLGRALRGDRVDLVHSFLFEANAVARVAARRARAHLVASFRSTLFRLPAERWLEQSTGNWVSRYTAVSHAVAREAATSLGLDPARIVTIHNGVAIERPPPPPPRVRTLGYLGRLHPEKGLDVLLRALGRLGPTAPPLLVAGDGPQRQAYQRLADQLGLAARTRFLGRVDRAPDFLDSVDALVVPSLAEGFSNAALEAMARARPVIASDVAGNRELVSDGETGALVPPGDEAALAAAIAGLVDSDRAAAWGCAGLARVRARFTEAHMVEQHLALWQEVARLPLPRAWAGW